MRLQSFDEFVRGVGGVRDRRSALGLLTGAVLAAWRAAPGDSATAEETKGVNKCKDKDEKQEARKRAHRCAGSASSVCLLFTLDVYSAAACAVDAEACCHLVAACLDKQARQCARQVAAKYAAHSR